MEWMELVLYLQHNQYYEVKNDNRKNGIKIFAYKLNEGEGCSGDREE